MRLVQGRPLTKKWIRIFMMDAADYRSFSADYRSFSNGHRTAADEGETQIPHSFSALMQVHEQLLKTSIDHREIEEKSKITGTMTPRRWTWKRALLSRYIC